MPCIIHFAGHVLLVRKQTSYQIMRKINCLQLRLMRLQGNVNLQKKNKRLVSNVSCSLRVTWQK